MRVVMALLLILAIHSTVRADEGVLGGLSWMNGYPATWNSYAPKVVYDGLFTYSALAGFNGSEKVWSIVRRRGLETTWSQGAPSFTSNQPPVMYLDRKGRLNVLCNTPKLRHVRFPHPQVSILEYADIPTTFAGDVAYLSCSYDAKADTALVVYNELPSWTVRFSIKYTDANDWTAPSALPVAPSGSLYLYAKPVFAGGRYAVLVGEHPVSLSNGSYVGAVLFESNSPFGPWSTRVIHHSTGANYGVAYSNWCFPLDLRADGAGRLRATMHIGEDGSGHVPVPEGMHVARQEDNYALRRIGSDIDDGFPLVIDESGVAIAYALLTGSAPSLPGQLVYFKSTDGCLTWSGPNLVASNAINPTPCDRRSGSIPMPRVSGHIYAANKVPPYANYRWGQISLGIADTPNRNERWTTGGDGAQDYVRVYNDPSRGLETWFTIDNVANGISTLTYLYRERGFYQVYTSKSNGSWSFYNSEGYTASYSAPESYGYWQTGADGVQDYWYIYKDPANAIDWYYVYDYDRTGAWVYSYVYRRGSYWYQEIRRSNGSFVKSDGTGYQASG